MAEIKFGKKFIKTERVEICMYIYSLTTTKSSSFADLFSRFIKKRVKKYVFTGSQEMRKIILFFRRFEHSFPLFLPVFSSSLRSFFFPVWNYQSRLTICTLSLCRSLRCCSPSNTLSFFTHHFNASEVCYISIFLFFFIFYFMYDNYYKFLYVLILHLRTYY